MTDRVSSITLVLEKSYRIDDLQPLIDALYQFKGVVKVKPNVADIESYVAYAQARHALQEKIWEALKDPKDKT